MFALADSTSLSTPQAMWLSPSGVEGRWLITESDLPLASTWVYFEVATLSAGEEKTGVDQLDTGPFASLKGALGDSNITWASSSIVSGHLVNANGDRFAVDGVFLSNAVFDSMAHGEVFFTITGIHATIKAAQMAASDKSRSISDFIAAEEESRGEEASLPASTDTGEVQSSCFSCRMACAETLRLDSLNCTRHWNGCMLEVAAAEVLCVTFCHEGTGCILACGSVAVVGTLACGYDRTICQQEARQHYDACIDQCGPITY